MTIFKSSANSTLIVGVVTFDSYVGIYAETLRYISWKLKQHGCEVHRLGCDGILGACTSLNSLGDRVIDGYAKETICRDCKEAQIKIPADLVINVCSDQSLLESDATNFLNQVESTLKIHRVVSAVLEMSYQHLPMCKIAFFDFAILLKLSTSSQLSESAIARFILGLKDLLLLQQHFEKLLHSSELTHIVYVNGNYSLNTLLRMQCAQKKIVCLSIESQLTSQHILNYVLLKQDRLDLSPEALCTIDLEPKIYSEYLSKVLENFGARITGDDFNAYTSLGDVYDQNETKVLQSFFESYSRVHSFFMSSQDELVPHIVTHNFVSELDENCRTAFTNQFEFIQFYMAEAAKNLDIGFVIRVHPRMAVNKRDSTESADHIQYKNLFAKMRTSPNVLVILGDSKVSSYFIISKSNLVVVSWSTIGLEALMMGTPVVSVFPNNLMFPLSKFSKQPRNFEELKIALFSDSDYGRSDDMSLFSWVSMAHEGQFFQTPAPRGQGGRLGKIYRSIYRAASKFGAYDTLARLFDMICIRGATFSDDVLLKKKEIHQSSKDQINQRLINLYRDKLKKMLTQYENRLSESAQTSKLKECQNKIETRSVK
jgi:hypothetical protein